MANWPRFNPNRFKDYQKSDMRNRAVLDAYEPGSMMKLMTYASAVDGAGVRPNDPVDQNRGKITIGSHTTFKPRYLYWRVFRYTFVVCITTRS